MSTKSTNTTYWDMILGYFEESFDFYFFSFLVVCGLLQVLCFPFYVYVNRKNRDRDKESLVFPITNSFYTIMKLSFFLFVLELFNEPIWQYFAYKNNFTKENYVWGFIPIGKSFSIFRAIGIFCDEAAMGINRIFQFFLSMLAIQKFFLYFFEDTRQYIEVSQTKMRIGIYLVCTLAGLRETLRIVRRVACQEKVKLCLDLHPLYFIVDGNTMEFFLINTLFIITAFLYLPIMVSIMKMSNLRSVKETQPQRYVLWQTMAVLISKLGFIPLFLYLKYYYGAKSLVGSLWYFNKFDNFTAPLTIQVSYLGCNKKNLEILIFYFKRKFKIGSVEPTSVSERTSMNVQRTGGSIT